jgi:hypothetical protein
MGTVPFRAASRDSYTAVLLYFKGKLKNDYNYTGVHNQNMLFGLADKRKVKNYANYIYRVKLVDIAFGYMITTGLCI